jgi:hypothetical protein
MEDDLVIFLVKQKQVGMCERLVIPGIGSMADLGFSQKGANPIIVTGIIGETLKSGWGVIFVVAGHFDPLFAGCFPFSRRL